MSASSPRTDWMASIPVTRVVAAFVPSRSWRPPPDLAVTLRGAVGKAVMDIACTRPAQLCTDCARAPECPVPTWYDPGRMGGSRSRPFQIRVETPDRVTSTDPLVVSWTFIGPLPRPTLFIEALLRAAAIGLGPDRIPHRLDTLQVFGDGAPTRVVADDVVIGHWPAPIALGRVAAVPEAPIGARVELVGRVKLPAERPVVADLLRACIQRVRQLQRELDLPSARRWPEPDRAIGRWERLDRVDASRWSTRQRARIDLSGFVGAARLGPEVAPFADVIAAASVLGIGAGGSAGMGWIGVDWEVAPADAPRGGFTTQNR